MNLRFLLAATLFVTTSGALLTTVGIQDRFETARARALVPLELGLATGLHRGPLPCRRYVDVREVQRTETSSAAHDLVRAGLATRWIGEVVVLTWRWTQEAERAAHAAGIQEERTAQVFAQLAPADRFWLRTIGKNRLEELADTSTTIESTLHDRADDAERRMPAELQVRLRALWERHPRVLARPAEVGLFRVIAAVSTSTRAY